MKRSLLSILIIQALLLTECVSQQKATSITPGDKAISFPGAEGFGKFTTGGRGGRVIFVTNLNDDGEGSFRKAVTAKDKRIIIFALSGTIHLNSKLNISGDCTIAGQSAPGDGICIADAPVVLSGDNIIVRYLRFRMGDKNQKGGMVDGSGGDDAFGGTRRKNIMVDHCTMSWSTDEALSIYAGDSTTLQWNIISEPLNYSYHFETGDKDYEKHGYGGIWGGRHLTAHHNLFAHCTNRTPRFDGTRNSPEERVDYCNNVIYNWGGNNVYAGEGGNYNIVNNYYKPGPATSKKSKSQVVNPYKIEGKIPFGKFFVEGNYVDGSPEVTVDNWQGVVMDKGTDADKVNAKLATAFSTVPINLQTAVVAYGEVLQHAGASFPLRDSIDARIVNDVKNRTGRIIDVQGGFPHGTDFEKTSGAWPQLASTPGLPDSDQDGLPDFWETDHKLDPSNPADGKAYTMDKQYTNVEVYLNNLILSKNQ